MGLLGPNGAGKSTTLKAVTSLLTPTSGTVKIDGIDISDHRRAMEHVGCVIETPEPYPNFTLAEIMDYIGRLYGMDSREIAIRARDSLESVRMWEWRNKKIGGFSKGMRQRVILAQALLPNPDTIILDEPTSGLDPRGMIEIRQTLAELKSRDRSLLISTHILKEVSEICGSVTMIRDGHVIASGDVSNLIRGMGSTVETIGDPHPQAVHQGIGDGPGRMRRGEWCGENGGPLREGHVLRNHRSAGRRHQRGVRQRPRHPCGERKGGDLESLYMELTKGDEIQ